MSAYERGLKTPSLRVAARLLGAMGWELTLRSRIDFVEHHPTGIVAFWVPNRLWRVPTPDCFATIRMPDLLLHTEQGAWDLRDRTDRRRLYELLIRRGLPDQMIRWLDGGFLVEVWDELDLPDPVREAWLPAVHDASRSASHDSLRFMFGEEPWIASNARIAGRVPLPPPPRPVRRRSRFDPR